jgi:hypothetical protein
MLSFSNLLKLARLDVYYLAGEYAKLPSEKKQELDPLITSVIEKKDVDSKAEYDFGVAILELASTIECDIDPLENLDLKEFGKKFGIDVEKLPTLLVDAMTEDLSKLSPEERKVRLIKNAICLFKDTDEEEGKNKLQEAEEKLEEAKKRLEEEGKV